MASHSAELKRNPVACPVSGGVVDVGKVECQTASRPGGGCRGLQVGGAGGGSWGYGRGSQHGWFSTLATLRPWHNRRCRNSRSVREKFFETQNLELTIYIFYIFTFGNNFSDGHTYLLAPFTLVRLLPTVDTLVSLKVVTLDKPHITHVTCKWLLS